MGVFALKVIFFFQPWKFYFFLSNFDGKAIRDKIKGKNPNSSVKSLMYQLCGY